MKILFLDIDGVLNGTEDWVEMVLFKHPHNKGVEVLNRTKLALLYNIVSRTDAKIVVSSTWRLHYTIAELIALFNERCGREFFSSEMIIDRTPEGHAHTIRGHEVAAWLQEHPEVTQYVILDDNSDFLPEQKPNFVMTNTRTGMTYENMKSAIAILGSE